MICKWHNDEHQSVLSFESKALNLHLIFFLLCLSFRGWNQTRKHQKNLRTKINKNKIEQKINTELALYPFPHVLPGKKRRRRTSCPHFHPVSETFCFWQIREKKRKKSTLVYVHEQMNSRRKKKKHILMVPLFYTWVSLENKMKAAVVITLFVPPFTSLEHISSVQPTSPSPFEIHTPTFSTIPFLPKGTLFSCVPEGRH